MRTLTCFVLFFVGTLVAFGQDAAKPEPGLPKEAHAIFVAATPYYNYADAALKPWHLKASYQLYDDKGNPAEQGTYEYWWAAPDVYRSTWTRPGASHTNWHTDDGKNFFLGSREPLNYFEYKIQSALIHALPELSELDSKKHRLIRQQLKLGAVKLSCVMVQPLTPEPRPIQDAPLGLFPTYCFDAHAPVLRMEYSFGSVVVQYNHLAQMQGHFLPRDVEFFDGNRHILSLHVDTITGVAPNDPVFTPAAGAVDVHSKRVRLGSEVTAGMLIQKQMPVYPEDAKKAHTSGEVDMKAVIGRDGTIHDMEIVAAPTASMASSAMWAVSHWQYRPYLLGSEPVDVETTIRVLFKLDLN